jgi:hypothetical protein
VFLGSVADALKPGGAVIIYGTLVDEARRVHATGLPMRLNMLIETPNGFDYTPGECSAWLHDAGFEGGEARELPGPERMVIARK